MRCQDFEQLLNERLDAREEIASGVDRALDEHASGCASCRAVAERYQVLAQAIRALGPAPTAPAGFADRFMARHEASLPRAARTLRLPSLAWPLTVAAAAAAVVVVGLLGFRAGRVPESRPSPRVVEAIDPRKVTDALADATSAAWELALETSAPATRIGRDVLDSAVAPSEDPAPPLANDQSDAPDVLKHLGGRVNDRLRPISGTARHAFEFLLGPADEPAPAVPPPPAGGM
jgi:hypothetical protein